MLYTQTSLSLVYNLERVSKNLHCYSATYQFGIVAWLRLEPNSYSTKLYSLHRRCSFGPVAVALGQLSQSFVLSPLFCSWSWSCLCISWIAPWSWWREIAWGEGRGIYSYAIWAGYVAVVAVLTYPTWALWSHPVCAVIRLAIIHSQMYSVTWEDYVSDRLC